MQCVAVIKYLQIRGWCFLFVANRSHVPVFFLFFCEFFFPHSRVEISGAIKICPFAIWVWRRCRYIHTREGDLIEIRALSTGMVAGCCCCCSSQIAAHCRAKPSRSEASRGERMRVTSLLWALPSRAEDFVTVILRPGNKKWRWAAGTAQPFNTRTQELMQLSGVTRHLNACAYMTVPIDTLTQWLKWIK